MSLDRMTTQSRQWQTSVGTLTEADRIASLLDRLAGERCDEELAEHERGLGLRIKINMSSITS